MRSPPVRRRGSPRVPRRSWASSRHTPSTSAAAGGRGDPGCWSQTTHCSPSARSISRFAGMAAAAGDHRPAGSHRPGRPPPTAEDLGPVAERETARRRRPAAASAAYRRLLTRPEFRGVGQQHRSRSVALLTSSTGPYQCAITASADCWARRFPAGRKPAAAVEAGARLGMFCMSRQRARLNGAATAGIGAARNRQDLLGKPPRPQLCPG